MHHTKYVAIRVLKPAFEIVIEGLIIQIEFRISRIMLSILVLLSLTITTISCVAATTKVNESSVLLSFKKHVNDPLATLGNWRISNNISQWNGVTFSSQGHLVALHLRSLSLSGSTLATSIGELNHLRELHVTNSTFKGFLHNVSSPRCYSLEILDLSNNQIDVFPVEFLLNCRNVKLLNLSHNQLKFGSHEHIPLIGNNLHTLDLSYNMLGLSLGGISFSTCKSLKYLDLSNNQLSGEVSHEIFTNCNALEHVSLAYNNFSGTFPPLDTANNLRSLNLVKNSISKMTLSDAGCEKLRELDVSSNVLSEQVFVWENETMRMCPSLKLLNISNNLFSGPLFPTVVNASLDFTVFLPSVEFWDASFNHFQGEVPVLASSLKYLDLSSNNFSTAKANMCSSNLEILILTNNVLTGAVLNTSIASCSRLEMLDLNFNSIGGEIPERFCENNPRLKHLLVMANNLQGGIPPDLAACNNLSILMLGYNNLTGKIPPELSQLSKLQWLTLNSNKLTGTIPNSFKRLENLLVLQLANNSLEGNVPSEMNMEMIELRSNALSGEIPSHLGFTGEKLVDFQVLGNLKSVILLNTHGTCMDIVTFLVQGIDLQELERHLSLRTGCGGLQLSFLSAVTYTSYNATSPRYIDLAYNRLTGEIPAEIGDMQSLLYLNLGHNALVGRIPEGLANAKNLVQLDISHNELSGNIPTSCTLLTFLVIFDVSYNNLSGLIPLTGQFATFGPSNYEGNPELCGFPLPIKCPDNSVLRGVAEVKHRDIGVFIAGFGFGIASFVVSSTMTFFSAWWNRYLHKNWWSYYYAS